MKLEDVRCPKCNGEINRKWFSHLSGEDAIFIAECWCGDLDKKSEPHIFTVNIKRLREIVYCDQEEGEG